MEQIQHLRFEEIDEHDLLSGLRKRDRQDTLFLARTVGALFESQLRTAGEQRLADQVKSILNELRSTP